MYYQRHIWWMCNICVSIRNVAHSLYIYCGHIVITSYHQCDWILFFFSLSLFLSFFLTRLLLCDTVPLLCSSYIIEINVIHTPSMEYIALSSQYIGSNESHRLDINRITFCRTDLINYSDILLTCLLNCTSNSLRCCTINAATTHRFEII